MLPELFERDPRALRSTSGITIGHHNGIHRAGRGAGNPVEAQPGHFEQAIQHAPGKCAVRTTPLQPKIDQDGITRRLRLGGGLGGHARFLELKNLKSLEAMRRLPH
jgi:hypothetical protein